LITGAESLSKPGDTSRTKDRQPKTQGETEKEVHSETQWNMELYYPKKSALC